MWSLTSQRERRTSGPEDFQSSAKKDFFNTIPFKADLMLPRHIRWVSKSDISLDGRPMRSIVEWDSRLEIGAIVQERPVRVERKLSAILAADVAGYSPIVQRDVVDATCANDSRCAH